MNPGGNYVGARLADAMDGKMTIVFAGEVGVRAGERIVVDTEDGPEYAEVVTLTPVLAKSCSQKKAKRLLRLASDSESADFAERLELQEEAARQGKGRVLFLGPPDHELSQAMYRRGPSSITGRAIRSMSPCCT